MVENLPDDFEFVDNQRVWSWWRVPMYGKEIQIDLFVRAGDADYGPIGEIKMRKDMIFTKEEGGQFVKKSGH